jgi:hypothetical protein
MFSGVYLYPREPTAVIALVSSAAIVLVFGLVRSLEFDPYVSTIQLWLPLVLFSISAVLVTKGVEVGD